MNAEEKSLFKALMSKEEIQLPKRIDNTFAESLCQLLDWYMDQLQFLSDAEQIDIRMICTYLKEMAIMKNADDIFSKFCTMMKETKLEKHLNIIKDELPIDGYGISNRNLFRIRANENNKNYKRQDIFHVPMTMHQQAKALRYNIAGFPSLYLSSTIYCCCIEMEQNERDKFMASMFRLRSDLEDALYVVDLGVRPMDYVKYVHFDQTGRRDYNYTQYLYVYPLIAACSFIAASKNVAYVDEYSISNALYRWLYKYHSDKICGVRYFSCALKEYIIWNGNQANAEAQSNHSYTKYFINYAFSIESSTHNYSNKLSQAFLVTLPKLMQDCTGIKSLETEIKKSRSLQRIDDQ